jgi:hypothetical protein
MLDEHKILARGRLVPALQGLYFVATGVWPLLHMSSFLAVTGPKVDLWLVRTVGLLVAVMGVAMLVGSARARVSAETAVLAVGSCVALMMVDVVYVTEGILRPVYLLDAGAELVMLLMWCGLGWLVVWVRSHARQWDPGARHLAVMHPREFGY